MDYGYKFCLFLVGGMFGFLIGEIVFYRPMYSHYKEVANEYCEKWFKLHRHACEAWWALKAGKSNQAFNELDQYYGDDNE